MHQNSKHQIHVGHVRENPSRIWVIERWDIDWAGRGMLNKKKVVLKKKTGTGNGNVRATAKEKE